MVEKVAVALRVAVAAMAPVPKEEVALVSLRYNLTTYQGRCIAPPPTSHSKLTF